ncbi:MAG TPA: hypothetical protein VGK58_05515 [Lacipirellulaceae bacterium]
MMPRIIGWLGRRPRITENHWGLAPATRLSVPLALTAFLLSTNCGCYDGDSLVTQARSAALSTHLAEVDLGLFHTSLPRDPKTGSVTQVRLRIFGNVPRYQVAAIEQQLRIDEYRLRHETIAAVRATSTEELADPSLASLRQRIERIVNGILDEAPVKTIGFYEVAIRRM